MAMTMAEQLLARASGRSAVNVGEIVVCDVDRIVHLDSPFTSNTEPLPIRVDHPERIAIILDHEVPAPTVNAAIGHRRARTFVETFGISHFFDVGQGGIGHQVLLENGLSLPGELLACSDSHTCAAGAVNCGGRGLGRLEMLKLLATGKTWYIVYPSVRYEFSGAAAPGVFGKDILLYIADKYGSHAEQNIEYGGPGLATLSMDDRATIATMSAEVNCEFALFEHDQITADFLRGCGATAYTPVTYDENATYAAIHEIDLDKVEPYVALPGSVPNNTKPLTQLLGTKVDQAFIGSCANGKLTDLRIAAEILDGRHVDPATRLVVTPASQKIYLEAVKRGYVAKIVEAGGIVTNATCGACGGLHLGVLGPGEVCVTSSTRNFRGRMGHVDAQIYIASSATAAASAVEGRLADPRKYLRSLPGETPDDSLSPATGHQA